MLRMLRNSWAGLCIHICFAAWCAAAPVPLPRVYYANGPNQTLTLHTLTLIPCRVSGAFYTTVSWLAAELKTSGLAPITCQGILIVSLIPNAIGLLGMGMAFDRGARAVHTNAAIVAVGIPLGAPPPHSNVALLLHALHGCIAWGELHCMGVHCNPLGDCV